MRVRTLYNWFGMIVLRLGIVYEPSGATMIVSVSSEISESISMHFSPKLI